MAPRLAPVTAALFDRRLRWGLAATTLLIAANWFVYVLAVTSGQVLDASLGYFLCPLVNVALGVLVLKERLTPGPDRGRGDWRRRPWCC